MNFAKFSKTPSAENTSGRLLLLTFLLLRCGCNASSYFIHETLLDNMQWMFLNTSFEEKKEYAVSNWINIMLTLYRIGVITVWKLYRIVILFTLPLRFASWFSYPIAIIAQRSGVPIMYRIGFHYDITTCEVSVFGVILVRIQCECQEIQTRIICGKIQARITPNTDVFYAAYLSSVETKRCNLYEILFHLKSDTHLPKKFSLFAWLKAL